MHQPVFMMSTAMTAQDVVCIGAIISLILATQRNL